MRALLYIRLQGWKVLSTLIWVPKGAFVVEFAKFGKKSQKATVLQFKFFAFYATIVAGKSCKVAFCTA